MLLLRIKQVKLFYKATLEYVSQTIDTQTLWAWALLEIYYKEAIQYVGKDIYAQRWSLISNSKKMRCLAVGKMVLEFVSYMWWNVLQLLKIIQFTEITVFIDWIGTNLNVLWQYLLPSRTWRNWRSYVLKVGVQTDISLNQAIWWYLNEITNVYTLWQILLLGIYLKIYLQTYVSVCTYLLWHCNGKTVKTERK